MIHTLKKYKVGLGIIALLIIYSLVHFRLQTPHGGYRPIAYISASKISENDHERKYRIEVTNKEPTPVLIVSVLASYASDSPSTIKLKIEAEPLPKYSIKLNPNEKCYYEATLPKISGIETDPLINKEKIVVEVKSVEIDSKEDERDIMRTASEPL